MTGRDLIVYIMLNKLEDEQVFKDGKLLGFLTEAEAAEISDMSNTRQNNSFRHS